MGNIFLFLIVASMLLPVCMGACVEDVTTCCIMLSDPHSTKLKTCLESINYEKIYFGETGTYTISTFNAVGTPYKGSSVSPRVLASYPGKDVVVEVSDTINFQAPPDSYEEYFLVIGAVSGGSLKFIGSGQPIFNFASGQPSLVELNNVELVDNNSGNDILKIHGTQIIAHRLEFRVIDSVLSSTVPKRIYLNAPNLDGISVVLQNSHFVGVGIYRIEGGIDTEFDPRTLVITGCYFDMISDPPVINGILLHFSASWWPDKDRLVEISNNVFVTHGTTMQNVFGHGIYGNQIANVMIVNNLFYCGEGVPSMTAWFKFHWGSNLPTWNFDDFQFFNNVMFGCGSIPLFDVTSVQDPPCSGSCRLGYTFSDVAVKFEVSDKFSSSVEATNVVGSVDLVTDSPPYYYSNVEMLGLEAFTPVVDFENILRATTEPPNQAGPFVYQTVAETIADTDPAETIAETDADTDPAETIADTDPAETIAETDAETDPAETIADSDAETDAAETITDTFDAETSADPDTDTSGADTSDENSERSPIRYLPTNSGMIPSRSHFLQSALLFSEDQKRRMDLIPQNNNKLIRSMCLNEFLGAYIDSDYSLWLFGEEFGTDYFEEDTAIPIEVDITQWGGLPVKLTCTRYAMFCLTHEGELFVLGRGERHAVSTSTGQTRAMTFQLSLSNVLDVESSYHALYAVLDSEDQVEGVKDVVVIGENLSGSFGANSSLQDSRFFNNNFTNVVLSNFPIFNVTLDSYDNATGMPVGDEIVIPTLKAFEKGVVFKFSKNHLYYAGEDHPSLLVDVATPELIDFELGIVRMKPVTVDHIDRIIGGCLYIVSGTKIFASGRRECNSGPGLDSNPNFVYPVELHSNQYGEFHHERIFDFKCAYSCFLVTESGLYMFGKSGSGLSIDHSGCENDTCKHIVAVTDEYMDIVNGLGKYRIRPDSQTIEIHNDFAVFGKPSIFNVISDSAVAQYTPLLTFPESRMENNTLTIVIRKPFVFQQMETNILFRDPENYDSIIGEEVCSYPEIGNSSWVISNKFDDDVFGNYDFFKLSMAWEQFRTLCGFQLDPKSNEYDVYKTRLYFTQFFFRGMVNGEPFIRQEEYFFDIVVKFKKIGISSEITVAQNGVYSEYFEAYVYDYSFDRNTRQGVIRIATITKFPNFLVSVEKEKQIELSDPDFSKLLFDEEFFELIETTTSPQSSRRIVDCDENRCFQNFEFSFKIIDDYRICAIPPLSFYLNWFTFCEGYDYAPSSPIPTDCIVPSYYVRYQISFQVDNLCGGYLYEIVDSISTLKIFKDWSYINEIDVGNHEFAVGDWVYCLCDVESNEKVSIEEVEVGEIRMENYGMEIFLYGLIDGLYQPSEVGSSCGLVIDELIDSPTRIGFHFQLSNVLLDLQPGSKNTYKIGVDMLLKYLGNQEIVRRNGRFGISYSSVSLDITIIGVDSKRNDVLAYAMFILFIAMCGISVVVLLPVSFITILLITNSSSSNKNCSTYKEVQQSSKDTINS